MIDMGDETRRFGIVESTSLGYDSSDVQVQLGQDLLNTLVSVLRNIQFSFVLEKIKSAIATSIDEYLATTSVVLTLSR